MNEPRGYAVFFFPQAVEALGGAIKPYLQGEEGVEHVNCRELDTGGAFIKMILDGRAPDGTDVELELMVPGNMVRMIVSARSDEAFGFGPRPATVVNVMPAPVPEADGSDASAAPAGDPPASDPPSA
ncbi:hypothetical protein H4F99_02465 [Lysobacter sp. SG-8]|uniref:Uncharacterized protein n=1 Tax=Marilutibacter penaei TaxID=2759900 RepID=A0A7W3U1U2_9GAMM|nr:hypothetical protein [Lysobacter penaei]MBB1087349.1 hypothetical protein [Lysobacter penaei]